jgi:Spy/CpxP family protein refolding chaperone
MTEYAPRKRFFLVPLAAALVAVIALPLISASPRRGAQREGRDSRTERSMERLSMRLDLDEAQKESVTQLMETHHQSMMESDKAMGEARRTLKELTQADAFDENTIRTAALQVGELEADRAVGRGKMLQQLRGVLSDEQYQEFIQMDKHRGRRMGRHRSGDREERMERHRERDHRQERHRRQAPDTEEKGSDL